MSTRLHATIRFSRKLAQAFEPTKLMVRLQKFLAEAGIGSRRQCEVLIESGKVFVNGHRAKIGQSVDPQKDIVVFNNKEIQHSKTVYIMLNKPKGYLSTVTDPFERETVLDLIPFKDRVYPVGRLDKDSEGLLLLTNDGEMTYRLTHPKFRINKVYQVEVQGIPSNNKLDLLREGVLLEDGWTSPCKIKLLKSSKGEKKAWLEIKIHEGKKREIRRMLDSIGAEVLVLRRVALGPLELKGLPSGMWRMLLKSEVDRLKKISSFGG